MDVRMDRSRMVIATTEELEKYDARYWIGASVKEKLQTITYLRECFYGPEATTGRLQGFHSIFKQK